MNENFLNKVGLKYFYDRIKLLFASQSDLDTLEDKVDEIIAEGGEPNVIETVKVNGTALTPVNKAVDVEVPTKTSDLTNDGDGTSQFATEAYVQQNGGKIDKIKVNGTEQTITNKAVDIAVPTNNNQLTNGAGYQTATDVNGLIDTALANGNDPYITESGVDTKIETALTSAMTYKGSVATKSALPSTGNKVGDFYNVLDEETNYAWDGTKWDPAGETIDTSLLWAKSELVAITTAEIDTIIGS